MSSARQTPSNHRDFEITENFSPYVRQIEKEIAPKMKSKVLRFSS